MSIELVQLTLLSAFLTIATINHTASYQLDTFKNFTKKRSFLIKFRPHIIPHKLDAKPICFFHDEMLFITELLLDIQGGVLG